MVADWQTEHEASWAHHLPRNRATQRSFPPTQHRWSVLSTEPSAYVPIGRAGRRSAGDVRCARSVRVPETRNGSSGALCSRWSAQRLGKTGPPTHQWRPENNGAVDSSRIRSEPFLESREVDVVL
jgi:hypothetical protein